MSIIVTCSFPAILNLRSRAERAAFSKIQSESDAQAI
jgi:hypothetical protein